MARFDTRHMKQYRLVCEAMWKDDGYGCSGNGPKGYSEAEAIELANEDGWRIVRDNNQDCWACPSHVNAKHNEDMAKHTEGE